MKRCCIDRCTGVFERTVKRLEPDLSISAHDFCAAHFAAYKKIVREDERRAWENPGVGEHFIFEAGRGFRVQ